MGDFLKIIEQIKKEKGVSSSSETSVVEPEKKQTTSPTTKQNNFEKNFSLLKNYVNLEKYNQIKSEYYNNVSIFYRDKEISVFLNNEGNHLKPFVAMHIDIIEVEKETWDFICILNNIAKEFKKDSNSLKAITKLKKVHKDFFSGYFLQTSYQKYSDMKVDYKRQFQTNEYINSIELYFYIPLIIFLSLIFLPKKLSSKIKTTKEVLNNTKKVISISLKDIQLLISCLFISLGLNYYLETTKVKDIKNMAILTGVEKLQDSSFWSYGVNSYFENSSFYYENLNVEMVSNWKGAKLINEKKLSLSIFYMLLKQIIYDLFISLFLTVLLFILIKIYRWIKSKLIIKIVE